MISTKTLLISGVVAGVAVASVVGAGMASAQSTNGSSGLVDKIASKFSLKEADVQAVFDEEREAKQEARQAEKSEYLQAAVDSGDITAEQKNLIEAKATEHQAEREAEKTALQAWADENDIDMRYVMGGGRNSDQRLDYAVESGDITADQRELIEAKQDELKKSHEANKEEMKTWAEENDVDLSAISGGFGEGQKGMGGPGKGGMRHDS